MTFNHNNILVDSAFYSHSLIENEIKYGKKIVYAEDIEKIKIEELGGSEKQSVNIPVVFVAGVTPYTEKFYVQLALKRKLTDNGYKVSQIGSKSYSGLFGFLSSYNVNKNF